MPPQQELEIVARYYDLMLWVVPEIGKIPRSFRFTLGEKMEVMLYSGFDELVRAKFASAARKLELLIEFNVRVERLRMFSRLARDLKVISHEKYERMVRELDVVGRLGGAWRKAVSGRSQP